jgi:hypothetical protein
MHLKTKTAQLPSDDEDVAINVGIAAAPNTCEPSGVQFKN